MTNIYVTKSFMPPIADYEKYLETIWANGVLTNQGPLLRDLELKMKDYLKVDNVHYVTNGTVALNLALSALDITEGEIITTPFSFVATTTSIMWERCTPVFVDINPDDLCIDPGKIEKAITDKTRAILGVHVFGYPCDIDAIDKIAKKHDLKVIYDGAHAFGSIHKGKSLLSYGDITTCSFHATKVFHTVEGGACFVNDNDVSEKLNLIKKFGFDKEDYKYVGINAKNSEFHAAMGLANIGHITEIIKDRKRVCDLYDNLLDGCVGRLKIDDNLKQNYAYYPAIFANEAELLNVFSALEKEGIFPRRYFYPSLNNLPYLKNHQNCPVSEDISSRIACLPLYVGLEDVNIKNICNIIKMTQNKT